MDQKKAKAGTIYDIVNDGVGARMFKDEVINMVGSSPDGSSDWQAKLCDMSGKIIVTIHGANEEEVKANAEFVLFAINQHIANCKSSERFLNNALGLKKG